MIASEKHQKSKAQQSEKKKFKRNPYLKRMKVKEDHLYLIADLNSVYWKNEFSAEQPNGLKNFIVFISQIISQHCIKSANNQVFVIYMNSKNSVLAFPQTQLDSDGKGGSSDSSRLDNLDFQEIQTRLFNRAISFMREKDNMDNINYSRIIPALIQALCKINKFQSSLENSMQTSNEYEYYPQNVIILNTSSIHSSMYNQLMSTVETAKKLKAFVSVYNLPKVTLIESTENHLKQLCYLTSGFYADSIDNRYFRELTQQDIIFNIMNVFSIIFLTSREVMAPLQTLNTISDVPLFLPPSNSDLEFIVNCSCHNKPMKSETSAYICSNCFFLYCSKLQKQCENCGTNLNKDDTKMETE